MLELFDGFLREAGKETITVIQSIGYEGMNKFLKVWLGHKVP